MIQVTMSMTTLLGRREMNEQPLVDIHSLCMHHIVSPTVFSLGRCRRFLIKISLVKYPRATKKNTTTTTTTANQQIYRHNADACTNQVWESK